MLSRVKKILYKVTESQLKKRLHLFPMQLNPHYLLSPAGLHPFVCSSFRHVACPSPHVMVPVCQASQEKWQSRVGQTCMPRALYSVIRHFNAEAPQPARLNLLPPSVPLPFFFFFYHSHSLFPHIIPQYNLLKRTMCVVMLGKQDLDGVKKRQVPCF